MRNGKFFIILILLCTFNIILLGQSVELLYKDRKVGKDLNIRIYFSDENGNESISPDVIAESPFFYFCYAPIGNWTFGKKDIKKLVKPIQLKQNGNTIPNVGLNQIKIGEVIAIIVLSFNKEDLDYTNNFYFENKFGRTELLNVSEEYWPIYDEYHTYYQQGKESFEANDYLKAFQVLKNFLTDEPRVMALTFYNEIDNLNRELVNNYVTENEDNFKEISQELEESLDQNKIDKLVMSSMVLSVAQQNFVPYFNFRADKSSLILEQRLERLISDLNSKVTESNLAYRNMKLAIFETGYHMDYKFELFIDLLARLILDIDFLKKIEAFKEIDVTLLDKYPSKRQELEELEWIAEFTEALKLINEDIKTKGYIVSSKTIRNLKNQQQFEKQPYYNIFMAFNALVGNDQETFIGYIKDSFKVLTEPDMLYIFEFWYISYLATKNNISVKVIASLNKGIKYEKEGDFSEANKQYKIAMRLSGNFAPPMFFLGKNYHAMGEGFTAERYFSQSLKTFPEYMAPRLLKITFLTSSEDYKAALNEVNSALSKSPYWFFYYRKAQILVNLKRYKEAKDILVEKCMTLIEQHFDTYILLGNISIFLQDKEGAKEFYLKAGDIDPENQVFIDRMRELER